MIRAMLYRTHPIVRRDAFRPRLRGWLGRRLHSPRAPLALTLLFILLLNVLSSSSDLYASMLIVIFFGGWFSGLLGVWAGGPLIADEFNRRTWDQLAITPYTTAEIVRAKFAAALWRLRYWLLVQVILRGVFVLWGLGAVLSNTSPYDYYGSRWSSEVFAQVQPRALAFGVIFVPFALAQPVLAAAAGASLGILCSTLTRNSTLARGLALGVRVGLWIFSWALAIIVFARICIDVLGFDGYYDDPPWLRAIYLLMMAGHFYEFSALVDTLRHAGGWVLAPALAVIVALALIPTWLALRAATAILGRRRR